MFAIHVGSGNEESIHAHDVPLEFSFDISGDLEHSISTTKSTGIEDDVRSDFEASSPVSFTALNFSPILWIHP